MAFESRMEELINYYTQTSMNGEIVKKVPIPKTNPEYVNVQTLVLGEFNRGTTSIYRIENPILYSHFMLKYAERKLDGDPIIKELYHCTSAANVDSIITNNFDWHRSRRTKYGRGVSFATNAAYANLQSSLQNGMHRAMILTDVIVTNCQYGNKNTVIPVEPCDTTISECEQVYVKYCNNEFYPKYVIYYDTYPVKTSSNGERYLDKSFI